MPATTLNTIIRSARLNAGLSQAEMAKQMKLSQGYISQLESGSRTPSLRILKRLVAQTTGFTLADLIDAQEAQDSTGPL